MIPFIILIAIVCVFWLLALRGRTGHPGMAELRRWKYAHRGLHGSQKPENSMVAFRAARDAGYGVELDVHLLADGNLAVIHDSLLKRTTGREGRVEDLSTPQLMDYKLGGTDQTIPEFRQVLELFAGKAPLIVELKVCDNNYARLCQTACDMLADYPGPYCMESFDPRCIIWLRKNRPDIIRGQLAENYLTTSSKLPWILKFALTNNLGNFLSRPDFVAYKYAHRKTLCNRLCRRLWKTAGVSWTLKTKEEYDTAVAEDWIPIFEGFMP